MKLGTPVWNPTRRAGESGYTQCTYCKLYYTKLGVARHWSRCQSNPKNQPKGLDAKKSGGRLSD